MPTRLAHIHARAFASRRGAGGTPPVSETVVMSMGGITATYDSATASGTYANGEPWVSSGGASGAFTAQSPAAATATRTLSGGKQINSVPSNGAQLDPGRAASGATLADRQAVNDGETATLQGYDGLDDVVATDGSDVGVNNLAYDAALNVAADYPLSLAEGSLVVAQSALTGISNSVRPAIEGMGVFTVAPSAAAAGDFRPGVADPSKTPMLNTADFDLTKLRNLDSTGYSIPDAATVLGQLRFETWQHTYNVLSRNIVPGEPIYGGDRYTWTEAMVWVHFDAWTAAEKRDICHAIAQHAIDLTARAEQGGIWQENGGHCAGPMAVVAFTAWLTGNARMLAALAFTTDRFSFDGAPHSIWGSEGRQFFYITQADIAREKDFPFTQDLLGAAEWSSDATRDDPVARRNERQNSLGVETPDGNPSGEDDYKQVYRHIIARVNVPTALAATLGGWRDLLPPAMLDYQDRHMDARIAAGAALPQGGANDISADIVAAWQAHRTGAPVYAIVGQSQNERILSNASIATTDIPKPTLVAEGAVTLYTDPDGTGGLDTPNITVTEVTQANVDAGLVNPAMAALSDLLAYRAPGKRIVIADLSVPGTGFASMMNDSDPDRMYAHFKGMVDRLAADGTPIAHLLWNWMGNDAAEAKTYDLSFAPLFLGQRHDGSPFTLGTANPDSVRGDVVDHTIYDIEAGIGDLGRGTFTRAGTKISFVGWPSFNPREVGEPEMVNFTTTADASFAGYSAQVDAPARARVKALLADARFDDMRGWHGPSCHVVRMTQNDGSGGSTLATHPDYREADGLILMAWPFAVTMLRDLGDPLARNFEIASVTVSSDGREARFQVVDTDGNALRAGDMLTTLRAHRGTAVPDPLPPHWQPVVGLEIGRAATGQRRPIWNAAAGRDAGFTGTVAIDGDEIVVTPSVPFANGDTIELLRGDASAVLLEDRDATARLYLDMPIVHVPELKQAAATYPMEGIPVDPHAIMTVSGVTGTPPTAQRFTLGTAAFTDTSNIPAGTTAIEYEAKLVFNSEFAAAEEVFGATSDIRIEVYLTGGILTARSVRIEDSAGTVVLGLATLAEFSYSTGTVLTLNVMIDWAARTVTVSRDGTELSATPFTTSGNGQATTARPLNLLSYNSAATLPADTGVEYVKASLTTPGGRFLRKELSIAAQGSAAGINADPWHVAGSGSVTATA